MASLQDAIEAVMDVVGAIDGINKLEDYPPNSLDRFPFAFCYVVGGTGDWLAFQTAEIKANLVLELHFARSDVTQAVKKAMAYSDNVLLALMNEDTLGDCGFKLDGPIGFTFGPMDYGETATIGWRWTIPVQGETSLSA